MSNVEVRRSLFTLYSTQVAFFALQHKGSFLCPICGNRFGPSAVETHTLEVDLAHVYPESVGGNLETLTCCKCNSTMGTRFDSQIAIEHRLQNAIGRGTDPIPARIEFDGGSVGGRVARSGKSWHFEMVEGWSKPEHYKTLLSNFAGLPKWTVRFYDRIDNPRHNAAILCAAYLNLFREYGYEYVAFADAAWIRDALLADESPAQMNYLLAAVPEGAGLSADMLYATGIADLQGVRMLASLVPSPVPNMLGRLVLLPGFGPKAADDYRRLQKQFQGERIDFAYEFACGAPEQLLADPAWANFLHELWSKPPLPG